MKEWLDYRKVISSLKANCFIAAYFDVSYIMRLFVVTPVIVYFWKFEMFFNSICVNFLLS